jgi:hypothetical protein
LILERSTATLEGASTATATHLELPLLVDNTSSAFAKAVIEILPDLLMRPTAGWGRRAVVQVDHHGLSGIDISSHRAART